MWCLFVITYPVVHTSLNNLTNYTNLTNYDIPKIHKNHTNYDIQNKSNQYNYNQYNYNQYDDEIKGKYYENHYENYYENYYNNSQEYYQNDKKNREQEFTILAKVNISNVQKTYIFNITATDRNYFWKTFSKIMDLMNSP